jgi:hypothetical protein
MPSKVSNQSTGGIGRAGQLIGHLPGHRRREASLSRSLSVPALCAKTQIGSRFTHAVAPGPAHSRQHLPHWRPWPASYSLAFDSA